MVKKTNENNMNRKFMGDDEPQEVIKESEEQKSEDSEEKNLESGDDYSDK
jgi:hypothetical protein